MMKKMFLLSAVCMLSLTATLFGQAHTQSFGLDDGIGPGNAGSYSPSDHFSIDMYLTFNGYDSYGFDLWFQTTTNVAPFISITGFTYGTTFDDPNHPFLSFPQSFTLLQSNGQYTTPPPSDLGATVLDPNNGGISPGTYFVGQVSISLSGLPPGVYVLQTNDFGSHACISVSHSDIPPNFSDEPIPAASYTITVVPEPGTLALLSLGAIGLVAASRMRKG